MDIDFKKKLIFRHLLFFILKQVVFIVITIGVFALGFYILGEMIHEFLNTSSSKTGVEGCIESIVMFFIGIFVVLIFGFMLMFALAVFASFMASILINYIVSEIDVTQKQKSTGQKIGHSIIPPIGGIAAASFISGLLFGVLQDNAQAIQGVLIIIVLFAYFGANYYFDRKFYMEGIVKEATDTKGTVSKDV